MTKVIPVAFAGLARSGKTTAVEHLENHFSNINGVDTLRMSFAGPIKDGLEIMGVTKESHPQLYRVLAQTCGDGCRNPEIGGEPLWWIDLMRRNIESITDHPALDVIYVLIDDVRYENELKLITKMNGVTFFVDAGKRVDTTQKMYEHASEKMAMNVNHNLSLGMKDIHEDFRGILDNNGKITYYLDQLTRVAEMLEPDNYLVEIGVWR